MGGGGGVYKNQIIHLHVCIYNNYKILIKCVGLFDLSVI